MSYSSFAQFYDILTQNIPYRKRGEYFNALFKKYGLPGSIVLDLACGTGTLTEILAEYGYDMIGVDSSEDMLAEAINKKYENESSALYLCQDMTELDLFGTIDGCVCALDSVNHITDIDTLREVFKKVSLFLAPGGIFIFDANTVYKHEHILSEQTYVYDLDGLCCVWQNSKCEDRVVDITLDFFEEVEEGLYERSTENFSEKAYTHEELCTLIKESGLVLLDCFADDSFEAPAEDTQRAVYIARSAKQKG